MLASLVTFTHTISIRGSSENDMTIPSIIYSVTDKKRNVTEMQLCLSKAALIKLKKYCAQIDLRRVRGCIQEDIYIGRSLYHNIPAILSVKDIQAQVMRLDREVIQDESNYRFYRNGLRISPTEIAFKRYDIDYFEFKSEAHEELVIYCDRNRFECFFQFLRAFSDGFWGDCFEFSETFRISTCIHDYTEDDLPLLYDPNY